jgi:hypothetical protein
MEDLPDTRTSGEDLSLTAVLLCVLLAGALSMFCAEVLSGASVLWFVTAWGWLVTLPLYMVHLVFLFSLAVLFRRTSLTSLYLWGVIFGMYESWITKVTWAGYIGSEPAWGTVLGFAPAEFLIIVLFWHPVMSFILPLLLFETLSSSSLEAASLLPGHRWLLAQSRRSIALFSGFALIGAAFLTMNSGYNTVSALVTLLVSAGIVAVAYKAVVKVTKNNFSVFSLALQKKGLIVALTYLAALYILAFFFLVPDRIPPAPTILLTVLVYAVVALLIWLDRPANGEGKNPGYSGNLLGARYLAGFLLLASGLIVLFSLVPPLGGAVGTAIYLLLIILGPVLAITVAGLVLFRFMKNHKAWRGVKEQ